jgi:hypothetical protein
VALVQPLGLLPLVWARAVVQAGTFIALCLLAGPRFRAWAITLSSAPALLLVGYYVNLDALAAVGVLLPAAGGIVLLAAKPQAAGLAALVWLARGKWRAFAPLAAVVILATVVWAEWLTRVRDSAAGGLNVALFPYSLVIAVPLVWVAIRRNDVRLAALATPLAVPYVAFYSLAPAIALLTRRHWSLGLGANVLSWVVLWWLMERLSALR